MKKLFLFLILVPFLLVLGKCTMVHFSHDAAAQRLLVDLRRQPLPQDSRVIYEHAEVGSYAATGDNTGIFAFRVFVTDLPEQNVSEFFARSLKWPTGSDFGFCHIENPPQVSMLPIDSIRKHVPQSERNRAYILFHTVCSQDDGIWDVRGW